MSRMGRSSKRRIKRARWRGSRYEGWGPPVPMVLALGLVASGHAMAQPASAPSQPETCSGERTAMADLAPGQVASPPAFAEAEALNRSYRAVKIDSRQRPRDDYGKRLSGSLKGKSEHLEEVLDAYRELAEERSDAWRIAALFRAGEARLHFAELVEDAVVPKAFGPEQRRRYCSRLRAKTRSQREQALARFTACRGLTDTGAQARYWIGLCQQAAERQRARLDPVDQPNVEGQR